MTSNILATLATPNVYIKQDRKVQQDLYQLKKKTEATTQKVNATAQSTDDEDSTDDKHDSNQDAQEAYKRMMNSVNIFKKY
ncbi:hypothetical protein [Candidatus Epulonipiscium viviparus]|uniref:hypothetical protein n=1 Tax=Candidatus Epulonipiscium viviparus TaxID=420336 RepID=UPI00016C0F01|nr:hypothetical protein [Candidatus Epulopiscium viviparus]